MKKKKETTYIIEFPDLDFGIKRKLPKSGNLKVDHTKQIKMKEKVRKEYFRKTRKFIVTKLFNRNLIR